MRLRRSIERTVAGGMVLAVLVTVIQTTGPEPASAAELETGGADEVYPGSTVQVTGDGYLPLINVRLCWDQPRCNDMGTAEMGVLATSFSHTVTIPSEAQPGPHEIFACQTTCDSAPVEVLIEETDAPTTTTTRPPSSTSVTQTTTTLSSTTSVTGAPGTSTTTIGATTSTAGTATSQPGDAGEPGSPTSTDPGSGEVAEVEAVEDADQPEETEDEVRSAVIRYTPPTTTTTSGGSDLGIVGESSPAEAAGPVVDSFPRDVTGWAPPPAPLFWAIWLLVVAVAVAVFYAVANRIVDGDEPPG